MIFVCVNKPGGDGTVVLILKCVIQPGGGTVGLAVTVPVSFGAGRRSPYEAQHAHHLPDRRPRHESPRVATRRPAAGPLVTQPIARLRADVRRRLHLRPVRRLQSLRQHAERPLHRCDGAVTTRLRYAFCA